MNGMAHQKREQKQFGMAAALLLLLAAGLAGCESDVPTAPTPERAVVTFRVGTEEFRVRLNDDEDVDAAIRAQLGGRARIPNGRIVAGANENTGWSWHLEDVEFVEVAIELCDGRPSDVERDGTQFGGGRFCPWSATVVAIVED